MRLFKGRDLKAMRNFFPDFVGKRMIFLGLAVQSPEDRENV